MNAAEMLERAAIARTRALLQIKQSMELLILATPTSNVRNKLTDINMEIMEIEDELKGIIK